MSSDVVFDENVFPFTTLHQIAGRCLHDEIIFLPSDNPSSVETPRGVHTNDQYICADCSGC